MTRAEFDAACRAALREGMTGRWLPSERHLTFYGTGIAVGYLMAMS